MITFDKSDLQRLAISGVGALALSAACLVAAVGPARAATVAPAATVNWKLQAAGSVREVAAGDQRSADTIRIARGKGVEIAAQ
jgi:hypothetical protein